VIDLKKILVFLFLSISTMCFMIELDISNQIHHFIDVGNLLIKLSENDLQVGFLFEDNRSNYAKLGFLKVKSSDSSFRIGGTLGNSWTIFLKMGVNIYGITPGDYTVNVVLSPNINYMQWQINQKFFLGKNTLSFSDYERIGSVSFGFSRVYLRFQDREFGVYRIDDGIFPGFYPYTVGQTGEEGLFMGIGWMDGLAGFVSFRHRIVLKESSVFLNPFAVVKTDSIYPGIKMELFATDFKANLILTTRKVLMSVSF